MQKTKPKSKYKAYFCILLRHETTRHETWVYQYPASRSPASRVKKKHLMNIKIVNTSNNLLPAYETQASAGMDLRAWLPEGPVTLEPMQRGLVPTGLFMEIPEGYEGQVRPRSGLALKSGITVLNSPGTIDADYRGQICVILINLSDKPFVINSGDRIAQMIIAKCEQAELMQVETLSETERGAGGFGHTGKN